MKNKYSVKNDDVLSQESLSEDFLANVYRKPQRVCRKTFVGDYIWDKKSIERTIKTIISAKEKKTKFIHWLDRYLIWVVILFAVVGSFFTAFGFLPLLFLLRDFMQYLALGFIGLVLGVFFEFLIADLEVVEKKHHLIIMLIIPIVSIINFLFVINGVRMRYGIDLHFNSVFGGIIYSMFFLLPYVLYEFVVKRS